MSEHRHSHYKISNQWCGCLVERKELYAYVGGLQKTLFMQNQSSKTKPNIISNKIASNMWEKSTCLVRIDGMGRAHAVLVRYNLWYDINFEIIGEQRNIAPCTEDITSCGGRLLVLQWVVSHLEVWWSPMEKIVHCLVLKKQGFDWWLLVSFEY